MVDFPKLLATLREDGFKQGPLVVELVSTGDAAHTTAEARKARLYIEELTK
jgi:sugar phosphate isomerase/epimerase